MTLTPCSIIMIVLAAVVIGIILVFLMNQRRPANTLSLSAHTGPTTSNQVVGSGVTCGGTNPLFDATCGPNLVCSDKWGICVDSNNNPATCGPNSPCNANYICGDNSQCFPAFVPDPNSRYIIRVVTGIGPTLPEIVTGGPLGQNQFAVTGFLSEVLARQVSSQLYQWQFVYVPEGSYYAIINNGTPGVVTAMTAAGTPQPNSVVLTRGNWSQDLNQRFNIVPVSNHPGTYAIINSANNLALSQDPSDPKGLALITPNWNQDIKQQFVISRVPSP